MMLPNVHSQLNMGYLTLTTISPPSILFIICTLNILPGKMGVGGIYRTSHNFCIDLLELFQSLIESNHFSGTNKCAVENKLKLTLGKLFFIHLPNCNPYKCYTVKLQHYYTVNSQLLS